MKNFVSLLAGFTTLVHGEALETLTGDPDTVTVSGWGAGATFACMIQVILSDTIQGAYCHKGASFGIHNTEVRGLGQDDAITAESIKDEAISRIDELENENLIDSTSNLANRMVLIQSGEDDAFFYPKNQEATKLVFETYGMQDQVDPVSLELTTD